MSADLIIAGVQLGCAALTSADAPAECGLDMDVPPIAWNSSPGGPPTGLAGVGVIPARIWIPGAVTSGFTKSPSGPLDEKNVITSPRMAVFTELAQLPVTPVWPVRNATMLVGPSMWIDGTQWLSVITNSRPAL